VGHGIVVAPALPVLAEAGVELRQLFPSYENIAKIPIQEDGGEADLMTIDSRVGPAIGLTWLPTVSHHAVYDVLRALTDAGLVRASNRPVPSVEARLSAITAPISKSRRGAQKWNQGINQVGQMAL
jgi:hypothetical protein